MADINFFQNLLTTVGEYQRSEQASISPETSDHKGRIDLVTKVDRESERRLVKALRSEFPNDSILAEEETALEGSSGRRWIIDPLDGTTNYVHGHPFYGISVGLQDSGEITEGYTYFPELDDVYDAQKGNGARKNGEKIQVSSISRPIHSLLATGFADMRTKEQRTNLQIFTDLIEEVQGIRRGGAAVHDLCMVAEGVFEGFWEFNLAPWDVSAGAVIIREAGGVVSDVYGEENWLYGKNIVAGNQYLQAWLLDQLDNYQFDKQANLSG